MSEIKFHNTDVSFPDPDEINRMANILSHGREAKFLSPDGTFILYDNLGNHMRMFAYDLVGNPSAQITVVDGELHYTLPGVAGLIDPRNIREVRKRKYNLEVAEYGLVLDPTGKTRKAVLDYLEKRIFAKELGRPFFQTKPEHQGKKVSSILFNRPKPQRLAALKNPNPLFAVIYSESDESLLPQRVISGSNLLSLTEDQLSA